MLRWAGLIMWCLAMGLAGGAQAECDLTSGQVRRSTEYSKLFAQLKVGEGAIPVELGFLLAGQTRHLGDSAERRAMFDCVFEEVERWLAEEMVGRGGNPITVVERFRTAALGLMDDEELRANRIDPDREIASMFASPSDRWVGRWELISTSPTVTTASGKLYPIKSILEFIESDGKILAGSPDRDGALTRTAEPVFTEAGMSLELPSVFDRPIFYELELIGDGVCEGTSRSQKAITEGNRIVGWGDWVEWTVTGSRL